MSEIKKEFKRSIHYFISIFMYRLECIYAVLYFLVRSHLFTLQIHAQYQQTKYVNVILNTEN